MSAEDVAQVQDVAAGSVIGTTGVARKIRGATVALVSSGVFDITIPPGTPDDITSGVNIAGPDLDSTEAVLKVTPKGALATFADITHSSDRVKRVTLVKEDGTIREADFEFKLSRLPTSGGTGDDNVDIQEIAAGAVDGDGTVQKARGCTVARTGTGVYAITLDPSVPGGPGVVEAEGVCTVNLEDGATTGRTVSITHTSDTVKTVTIFSDAGAAVDNNFSFSIGRLLG